MNLAFSALLVILVAVPGAIFLESYRRGFQNRPVATSTFQTNLILYLGFSVPIHALSTWLFTKYAVIPLSLGDLVRLVAGAEAPQHGVALDRLAGGAPTVVWYAGFASVVAVLLGFLAHIVVRRFALDLTVPLLNPQSVYWPLFSGDRRRLVGRGLIVDDNPHGKQTFDAVFITVTVDLSAGTYLYWGLLSNYELGPGNRLESIMLSDAHRRPIEADANEDAGHESQGTNDLEEPDSGLADPTTPEEQRFYPIRGHTLLIEYDRVRSLNIEYLDLDVVNADGGREEEDAIVAFTDDRALG